MLVDIIKPDFLFEDNRGSLVQLVHDNFKQFNIIKSKKGVIRGDHYHKLNREAFYIISGKLELVLEKDGETEGHIFGAGDMFVIKPYIMHSFYFIQDTVLASMYDLGVELEDGKKDIYER